MNIHHIDVYEDTGLHKHIIFMLNELIDQYYDEHEVFNVDIKLDINVYYDINLVILDQIENLQNHIEYSMILEN